MILVTGGAGFIGGNFALDWLTNPTAEGILNLDKLTYAGNLTTLKSLEKDTRHVFVQGDIGDYELVLSLLKRHSIRAVVNFAAESHVDRSIHGPSDFIQTNVVGTFNLLEAVRSFWTELPKPQKESFRFLHVSTDEVYGSLSPTDSAFSETNPYKPNSPYSASKAASDHLVRAWHHTYGLPVLTTNCSNNYGPRQFPEKLVPVVIQKCLRGEPIPVYGRGENVRDWLFVDDHAVGLLAAYAQGQPGRTYCFGGSNERRNIDLVRLLCGLMDEMAPRADGKPHAQAIAFVEDRPGHDLRYAIDATRARAELGWSPAEDPASGFRKTLRWYLENRAWVSAVLDGTYRLERLGKG